jgi:hypothetical protein
LFSGDIVSWSDINGSDGNKGPIYNFNNALKKASGKYFMWAAGHDLWTSNYISACVDLLESRPCTVVASGISNWIDEHGAVCDIHLHRYGQGECRALTHIAGQGQIATE